jgi:hypothetical protein
MRVLLLITALAAAVPAYAATPATPVSTVPPPTLRAQDAQKAIPEPLLRYDSRRIMIRPMQLDDRVRSRRLGPTATGPKDGAGPEIR